MTVGIGCVILFGLISLSGSVMAQTRTPNILLFVGIVAIIAGVVRYVTARGPR